MRTGRARTGRIDGLSLVGCALLAAGVLLAGCKKDDETVVQESEIANSAPTPAGAEAAPTVTNDIAGAQLSGPGGATGTVTFTQDAGGVHVVARIEGAKPGQHGFHLHAGGTCDGPDFKSAGDHFNPTNAPHGDPAAAEHHAGDFGNVDVGADGTGNADFTTNMLTLGGGGANDALGKAVILHEGRDDLKTQPSGDSGARIACGVVQRAQGQAVTGEATPAATPGYQ
jgi:superoxide dismutase, Cu-Zn family